VLRGGSFSGDDPDYLRSSFRNVFSPGIRDGFDGFRFSRTP
jgi:formylglycine-generating enzyme required for sulfatase activity